jgi:outer membrane protein W
MERKSTNIKTLWILLIGLGCAVQLPATSRSTGIGFRGSLFRPDHSNGGILIHANGPESSAVISAPGGGAHLYFFSRMTGNWYLETSIGALGEAEITAADGDETHVKSTGMVPFLFGVRVDILPLRVANVFQPYVGGGPGYYMIQESDVQTGLVSSTISANIESRFGGYFGGGVNIEIQDWLAFNLDGKYHRVQKREGDDRSGAEFGFGLCFMWGRKRELFRIVESKIIAQNIYPAYYQIYNTIPIAYITIRSEVSYPIEVNLKSEIPGISERMDESGFIRVEAREEKDLPVYAIFGQKLLSTDSREPATLDIKIEARAGTMLTKTVSTPIVVHSRNAWDGDARRLSFFVTPEESGIRDLARETVMRDSTNNPDEVGHLNSARRLFDLMRERNLRYLGDPNVPFYRDDRVQFAKTTLETGTGDCDDLAVLYASLLESIGIRTAFVDVKDPEKQTAHVYLLVDLDIPGDQGHRVSDNPKRYVVRESSPDQTSCWIPVETTCVDQDFENAWQTGATQYLQEAELRNGLIEGWVKIFDVE